MHKVKKLLSICLIMLVFSGCWDYGDIDKKTIVLSTGIDTSNEEVTFTGEIAKLVSGGKKGDSSASVTDVYLYNSKGRSFEAARSDYDYKITNQDFTGAVRSIIFSQKYAREVGIESYINRIIAMPGFRNSVLVVISEQSMEELFSKKIINHISIGHGIEDSIEYLKKEGSTIYTTAQVIRQNLSFKDIGFLIPYIKREEDTIKYLGFAVMKNSKLIGTIKISDSTGAIYLINKNASWNTAIANPQDEDNLLSIKAALKKRKISTNYNEGKIYINIKLDIKTTLMYEYKREPISQDTLTQLNTEIEDMIKKEVTKTIKRSQEEFKCDIFGFARYFKAENPKIFKNINWVEEYPNASISVEVSSGIGSYNLINTRAKENYKGGVE